jgi:hypothetical protein
MSTVELNDDDVVSMKSEYSWIQSKLFLFKWLIDGLPRLTSCLNLWLNEGVECEVLFANGGGWQKGKMRLRLEFVPDNPEPSLDSSDLAPLREHLNSKQ